MKKKAIAVLLCVLALTVLGGFTVGGSGLREYYEVGSISAEMQLPADAGGPPHGGNHPPVGPLTLRGGQEELEVSEQNISAFITAGDREALKEIYTVMFERGELSDEEYALAKRWDWIIPESERIPLDDFEIDVAGIRTGTGWESGYSGGGVR